jgi:hypothetical protein
MDLSVSGWVHLLIFAAILGIALRLARHMLATVWNISTDTREAGLILGAVVGGMVATGLTRNIISAAIIGASTIFIYVLTKILRRKK